MSDEPRDRSDTDPSEQGRDLDERMKDLRARLDANQPKPRPAQRNDSAQSGIAQAWRLSSEFIAGVLVGTGIGWVIDRVFGTGPWGLIIFVLLGFGAAVVNVMRAAGRISPSKLNIDGADRDDTKE